MRRKVVLALCLGAVSGIAALTIAVWAAGGGHGSYLPAKLLFPYTMLVADDGIGFVGMLLAIVQWPLYAAVLLFGISTRRFHSAWGLGAAHVAAALVCLRFLSEW